MRFLFALAGLSLAQQTQKVPLQSSFWTPTEPTDQSADNSSEGSTETENFTILGASISDYDYDVTQPQSLGSDSSDLATLFSEVLAMSSSEEANSSDYDYDNTDTDEDDDAAPPREVSWSSSRDKSSDKDRSSPHFSRDQSSPNFFDMLSQSKLKKQDDDTDNDYDYDLGVSGNSPLSLMDLMFMLPAPRPMISIEMIPTNHHDHVKGPPRAVQPTTASLPAQTTSQTAVEKPLQPPPAQTPPQTTTPPQQTTPVPQTPQTETPASTQPQAPVETSPPAEISPPVEIAPVPPHPTNNTPTVGVEMASGKPKSTKTPALPDVVSYRSAP